jgi:hypothetical protein
MEKSFVLPFSSDTERGDDVFPKKFPARISGGIPSIWDDSQVWDDSKTWEDLQ